MHRWGSLQCSPRPLAGFNGAYISKGREGRKGKEGRGREVWGVKPGFHYPS